MFYIQQYAILQWNVYFEQGRKKEIKQLFHQNENSGSNEVKKRLEELFDLIKANEDGIKKCLVN